MIDIADVSARVKRHEGLRPSLYCSLNELGYVKFFVVRVSTKQIDTPGHAVARHLGTM